MEKRVGEKGEAIYKKEMYVVILRKRLKKTEERAKFIIRFGGVGVGVNVSISVI